MWDFASIKQLFTGENHGRLLRDGLWGLEKEAQRVTGDGALALTPHPAVFGDKSTNFRITTDFAESQIELITPPFRTIEETFRSLQEIQAEAEAGIGSELFWPLSMPPRLPAEKDIPLARFVDTAEGRENETYRRGLSLRYGKKMQMISGIHYNFSFDPEMVDYLYQNFGDGRTEQDFINWLYLAVTRNFLRYRWLLIYLFGATPAVDATYHSVICRELNFLKKCCPEYCGIMDQYRQFATSLRVSRFGYASPAQANVPVYFNDLVDYTQNLRRLMATKSRDYAKLGLYRHGVRMQLNDHVLQKESEFYAPIRLKQNTVPGETQLDALERYGVKYLEVRILDLNPFEKTGLNPEQLKFLQLFMLFCLFEQSETITTAEFDLINKNHHLTALFGRKPGLKLHHYKEDSLTLTEWGASLFDKLAQVAALMDRPGNNQYQTVVAGEFAKLAEPALLPAARMQVEMQQHGESFLEFGIRRALINKSLSE